MKVIEPLVKHFIPNGVIEGQSVDHSIKKYEAVSSLYKNKREDNPIVYEVYSYSQGEDKLGNLNWGLTVLKPILSQGECNMTKGHFHTIKDCAEFYFGISGQGLLLLMDETGYTWAEKVYPGSLHYIDGKYAHRLVNTGEVDMKVGACWPTSAGHDYQSVENREFGYRIFKTDKGIEFIKR